MNKQVYVLIGCGLLSAAALTSCQKEELLQETEGVTPVISGDIYTATAEISTYTYPGQANSRATVKEDGKTFYWEKDDQISIWDGKAAYLFKTKNYDGTGMFNFVEFAGEANLENGIDVSAVYPSRDNATADNIFVFTLAETANQNIDGKPHLAQTMHMKATGKVYDKSISQMKFQHLTSLFDFTIAGFEGKSVTISKIQIEASAPVFPMKLTTAWKEGGDVYTYADKKSVLTLEMNNVTLDGTKELTGYMNFFPTQDMKADTKLIFRALDDEEQEVAKLEGKVSELYGDKLKESNYEAGKRYGVTLLAGGDESHVWVKDIKTLQEAMVSHAGKENAVIKFAADVDLANNEWTPVAELKATLDGAGHSVKNVVVKAAGKNLGMFVKNSGTIQNLTLDNVSGDTKTSEENAGLLVAANHAIIKNCVLKNSVLTLSSGKPFGGLLAGVSAGLIEDCKITGTSKLLVKTNCNAGGLVGSTNNGSLSIKRCHLESGVEIKEEGSFDGSPALGSFLGWTRDKVILEGCSSAAKITLSFSTNVGGLIGAIGAAGADFKGCYSVGDITGAGSNSTGGGFYATNAGTTQITACYTILNLPENIFGNCGSLAGKSGGTVSYIACYNMSDEKKGSGVSTADGVKTKANVADLRTEEVLNSLNAQLSNNDFIFEINGNSDVEPLIIVKK